MEKIVSTLNDIIWNPGLVVLLLLTGLYLVMPVSGTKRR